MDTTTIDHHGVEISVDDPNNNNAVIPSSSKCRYRCRCCNNFPFQVLIGIIWGSMVCGTLAALSYIWAGKLLTWQQPGVIASIILGGISSGTVAAIVSYRERHRVRVIESHDTEQCCDYNSEMRICVIAPFKGCLWGYALGAIYSFSNNPTYFHRLHATLLPIPLTTLVAILAAIYGETSHRGQRRITYYELLDSIFWLSNFGGLICSLGYGSLFSIVICALVGCIVALFGQFNRLLKQIPVE
jgi:hypothetical protein